MDDAFKRAGLVDAEVGMKGTSTTFYSENPGKRLGHHWDADPENLGDYDINISSPTMKNKLDELGIAPSEKYGVFKTKDINSTFQPLDEFRTKWSGELGRDVNFVGYPKPVARDSTEYILRNSEATHNPLMISSNPATGNPAAIARGFGELNTRQTNVLDALPEYGSSTITSKSFGQNDLAALSAATGNEFAMFTTGGRRLIYRGDAYNVPVTKALATKLNSQGWRWSSHVHPDGNLMSSSGDRGILEIFSNARSTVLDPFGNRGLFNSKGDLISSSWLPTPKK